MGFLPRAFVPRSVRRATHPVRTVKRAATPRVVKQAQRSLHPASNAVYSVERSLNTKPRKRKAAGTNTDVVINTDAVARWFEGRFNDISDGPSMDSTVCEPDPSDPWALIATGRINLGHGAVQSVSRRIRVNPDGSWQVEG
jgi:hypothetical protein